MFTLNDAEQVRREGKFRDSKKKLTVTVNKGRRTKSSKRK